MPAIRMVYLKRGIVSALNVTFRIIPLGMAIFNPFKKITVHQLDQLMAEGYMYMAAQTFKRGFPFYSAANKTCILLTAYKKYYPADKHSRHVGEDPLAAYIQLEKKNHLDSVMKILAPGSVYDVYSGNSTGLQSRLVAGAEKLIPKIWEYLNEQVDIQQEVPMNPPPQLVIEYGEIYVELSYAKEKKLVKLEDIERS